MRRFLFSFFLVFCFFSSGAVVRTWTGPSGGNWSTGTNWSGGIPPISTDDAVINSSVTINIDINVVVNKLTITNNSSVIFQTSVSRSITPSAVSGSAFNVDAGSTLTMDCTNAAGTNNFLLDLSTLASTHTLNGTLIFSGTGGSASSNAKFQTTSGVPTGILTVTSTGYIKFLNNSGNATTSASSLIMQSGSTYELAKNGGSFPTGNWQTNSLAKASGTGINPPQFLGTTYGNLEINCPFITSPLYFNANISFNDVNIINTGADVVRAKTGTGLITYTLTINGNLTVSAASILETSGNTTTSGNPGYISVKGNVINNGIIRENSTVPGNQFTISGAANQNISGTGVWSGDDFTFIMSNSAGATLLSPLTLPYNLQLIQGLITTSSINLLSLVDNATYTGGSVTSFINGPMKKYGNDNFIFPVGKGGIYAPVGITNISGELVSDEFTAEYLRINPQSIHGSALQGGLNHVSLVEYWSLARNTGSAVKKVSLAVNYTSFCYSLANTYVSGWNGSLWTNEGSTNVAGPSSFPFESGTLTSTNNISSFGDFTLTTNLTPDLNPLPVTLSNFSVNRTSRQTSLVKWELGSCCAYDTKFELERSSDNRNFRLLAIIPGNASNRVYQMNDNNLPAGISYYRLKITESSGHLFYSKTVAVNNTEVLTQTITVWPNPAHDQLFFSFKTNNRERSSILIYDISGKPVKNMIMSHIQEDTFFSADISTLPAGIYTIIATVGTIHDMKRFIKQ